MTYQRFSAALIIATLFLITSSSTRADLLLSIQDLTVVAGEASSVDVLVSSDSSDIFQNYFLDFTVDQPGFFVESAIPAPQLTATEPDYIFLNDSFIYENDSDPANNPTGGPDLRLGIDSANDSGGLSILTVCDQTFSFDDRAISTSDGSFLLARLNFIAPTAGTFEIELDTFTSGFFSTDDFGDEFESAFIDEANSDLSFTVTATMSAVPEPSSFGVLLMGIAAIATRRTRRRMSL
jgi:hypothetical protein